MDKIIAIASDHAGFDLKEKIKEHFSQFSFIDCGTDSQESVDYPDFAEKLSLTIKNKKANFGILICGTGIGISIKANRYPWIRAGLAHDKFTAQMAREHNDANVLAMGARIVNEQTAYSLVKEFFKTEFDTSNPRHKRRVNKL